MTELENEMMELLRKFPTPMDRIRTLSCLLLAELIFRIPEETNEATMQYACQFIKENFYEYKKENQ